MGKRILTVFGLLSAAMLIPVHGQDLSRFTLDFGGGVSSPLNPTAQYAGVSGNFVGRAGYNINRKNAIIGEFMWAGLPPNLFTLHPINAPYGSVNLYTLTGNYRHQVNNIHGSPFGLYFMAGGGWYYRYASIDKNYAVPPNTVCYPIYTYWGYACDSSGYVYSQTVAYRGSSAGGANAGAGFTIRFGDSDWRFFLESRYHYAWSNRIPTTLIPVTFGIRFN